MKAKFSLRSLLVAATLSSLLTLHFAPQPKQTTLVFPSKVAYAKSCPKQDLIKGASVLYKPWDPHASEIVYTFNRLIPKPFLPRDQSVLVESMPLAEFAALRRACYPGEDNSDLPRLMGEYLPAADGDHTLPRLGNEIFLVQGMSPHDEKSTLAHEFGHHIWYVMCNDAESKAWTAIWNEEERTDTHPTEYAGTNESEGFAESFMLYCLRDHTLSAKSVAYFDALKARLVKTRADGWSTDSAD